MAAPDTHLIVVARPGVAIAALERAVAAAGARIRPVFAETRERLQRDAPGGDADDLSRYWRVHGPPKSLEALRRRLRKLGLIAAAFGTSPVGLPAVPPRMKARPEPPPPVTPNFTRFQRYLEPEGLYCYEIRALVVPGAGGGRR